MLQERHGRALGECNRPGRLDTEDVRLAVLNAYWRCSARHRAAPASLHLTRARCLDAPRLGRVAGSDHCCGSPVELAWAGVACRARERARIIRDSVNHDRISRPVCYLLSNHERSLAGRTLETLCLRNGILGRRRCRSGPDRSERCNSGDCTCPRRCVSPLPVSSDCFHGCGPPSRRCRPDDSTRHCDPEAVGARGDVHPRRRSTVGQCAEVQA